MELLNESILIIIIVCLIMTAVDNDRARKKEAEDRKKIIDLLTEIADK